MAPQDPNAPSGSGSGKRSEDSVKVPATDPKKKDDKKDEDLSEEDLELKNQLELYVERVQDTDPGVQKNALESMRQEIRTSTSSMTSVPKPLKYLRPHYGTLKTYYETMAESELKKYLADILSVLALTMAAEGERESLKYRLLGSEGDIGSWGHEYVRNLAGEIAQEFAKRQGEEAPIEELMEYALPIGAIHLSTFQLHFPETIEDSIGSQPSASSTDLLHSTTSAFVSLSLLRNLIPELIKFVREVILD